MPIRCWACGVGSTLFLQSLQAVERRFTPLISGAFAARLIWRCGGWPHHRGLVRAVISQQFAGRTGAQSGEQGIVEPGLPPRKTAVLNAINVIQWNLYYPAVLDVEELGLDFEMTEKDEVGGFSPVLIARAICSPLISGTI